MYWEVVEEIPKNWKIDKTAGSPVCGCVFITNGKSVINGQKRKLLRIKKEECIEELYLKAKEEANGNN